MDASGTSVTMSMTSNMSSTSRTIENSPRSSPMRRPVRKPSADGSCTCMPPRPPLAIADRQQAEDGDDETDNDDRSRDNNASKDCHDDGGDAAQVTSNQNNSKSGDDVADDNLRDSLDLENLDLEEADPYTAGIKTPRNTIRNLVTDTNKPDDGQASLTEEGVDKKREKRTSTSTATTVKSSASPPSTTAIPTPAVSQNNRSAGHDCRKCHPNAIMPPRDSNNNRTHGHPTNKKNAKGDRQKQDIDHRRRHRRHSDDDGDVDDLQSRPGEINFVRDDSLDDPKGDSASHGSHPTRHTHVSQHSSSSTTVLLLTKERIRSFMTDYYEDFDSIFKNGLSVNAKKACFKAFFDQYYTKDILWIRSSGNPIGRQDLAGMLCDDIEIIRAILVSIDSIRLMAGGLVATVVYTADLKFLYKGQPQSDRTVLSNVLHVANGSEMLIAHVHWSVGNPIPTESRWESAN